MTRIECVTIELVHHRSRLLRRRKVDLSLISADLRERSEELKAKMRRLMNGKMNSGFRLYRRNILTES